MGFKDYFLLERTRIEPEVMYHGTSSVYLPKIMKMGLLAYPKHKGYGSHIQSSHSGESMESIGGVYLSTNFMTSYAAANTVSKKTEGDPIIVVCQIMSKSAHADEDSIRNRLYHNLDSVFTRHLGGHSWWYKKGFIDANPRVKKEIIEEFAHIAHRKLSEGNEKSPLDIKLFEEYLNTRMNVHLYHESNESMYDYARGLSHGGSLPGGDPSLGKKFYDNYEENKRLLTPKTMLGSIETLDSKFLGVLDVLTRRYRSTAKKQDFMRTLRVTDDITFSGRNKIIGIIRLIRDETGSTSVAKTEYGIIPDGLKKDIENSINPDIKFVQKTNS